MLQHDGYIYFENAVTGQRRCRWDGNAWGRVDYNFMRSGMSLTGRSAVR